MAGVAARRHALQASLLIPGCTHHRMQDPPDGELPSRELLRDGVDQERRVVAVRLDHGVGAPIPVDDGVGVQDSDRIGLGGSRVDEIERRPNQREELLRQVGGELFVAEPARVGTSEGGNRSAALGRDQLVDAREQVLDDRIKRLGLRIHGGSFLHVGCPSEAGLPAAGHRPRTIVR